MVNPTGKEGAFWGADWVEESNNLFAKGKSSLGNICKLLTIAFSMTLVAEDPTMQR